MPDLNAIAVFVQVVERGSFSAAARALEMPIATVSRRVAELERTLGIRLLQRSTRRLSLTEAGAIYHQRCGGLLAELDEATALVMAQAEAPRGELRISAPVSLAATLLLPWVAQYLECYPDVSVAVQATNRYIDLIEEGMDLAIRVGALADSALTARKLGVVRYTVCASPTYLQCRGEPESPMALHTHRCIALGDPPVPWVFRDATGREISITVPYRLRLNDLEMARQAALAGLGVAYLPHFTVAQELQQGKLHALLCDWYSREQQVSALYPGRRLLSPKVSAFLDVVTESLATHSPW